MDDVHTHRKSTRSIASQPVSLTKTQRIRVESSRKWTIYSCEIGIYSISIHTHRFRLESHILILIGWQEFYLQNILCTASVLKCFTCLNKSNYCKCGYFCACNFSGFSDFWHFRLFLNSHFLAILHRPTYKINTFACFQFRASSEMREKREN